MPGVMQPGRLSQAQDYIAAMSRGREDIMKETTGIVRRIDDLGRVVIPKDIRQTLRIREGDPLEIFIDGEVILIRRAEFAKKEVII